MTDKPDIFLFADFARVQLRSGISFSTRAVRAADLAFLDALYADNMKGYVERVGTWDPDLFRENFEPSALELIEVEGYGAGFLRLVAERDSIYLAELQVGKKYQGKGIGSSILEKLIEYAAKKESLITLKVIRGNPAEFLYLRYGFRTFKKTDLHLHLSLFPSRRL